MNTKRKTWSEEELSYLKQNYSDRKTEDIAKFLGRSLSSVYGKVNLLGLHKSEAFLNGPFSGRLQQGQRIGLGTTFKKGNVPFNKGLKQVQYMSETAIEKTKGTRFKKGSLPPNTKTDGVVTVRVDQKGKPYQWIRLAKAKWQELHRYVWTQHHGAPPKGYNVQFKDGNTLNCVIENLYLIKRQDQILQNTINRYPVEIKETLRTLGKLKSKIKSYEKQD